VASIEAGLEFAVLTSLELVLLSFGQFAFGCHRSNALPLSFQFVPNRARQ
jgi:hypothetical protein